MAGPTGIGGIRRSGSARRVRALVPEVLVDPGRRAARAWGSATATRRVLPDYLVIGTKKGGTTSVANWLTRHPQVLGMVPRLQSAKSPHYFDNHYDEGPAWYLSHFATRAARERHARRTGNDPVTGETAPYYLLHPAVPARIAETAPSVRMVVMLREPVSRAYSHYWDRRATGWEDLPTFEEALAAEPERLRGFRDDELSAPGSRNLHHEHHTYLRCGEYADQLRRYLEHFAREQLLVLTADELRSDPSSTLATLERFLGLEHADLDLVSHNVRATSYPAIDPATRDRLTDHFAPHNADLEALLRRPLGW